MRAKYWRCPAWMVPWLVAQASKPGISWQLFAPARSAELKRIKLNLSLPIARHGQGIALRPLKASRVSENLRTFRCLKARDASSMPFSYEVPEALVYDPVAANRNSSRAALHAVGFRNVSVAATLEAAIKSIT